MRKILIILFLFIYGSSITQDKYPVILNFDVNNKTINTEGEEVWAKDTYYFLMLNPQKAIDLKNYGNSECEFNIIGSNSNRILLEFNQPSKLIPKGMCAAGLEKGFLSLELDGNAVINKSKNYLIESCLLSIESSRKLDKNSKFIKYACENLQTSESFIIILDTESATIIQEENK
jgi:hypothetical protein